MIDWLFEFELYSSWEYRQVQSSQRAVVAAYNDAAIA